MTRRPLRNACCVLALCLLHMLWGSTSAQAQTTLLALNSDAGDFVGGGRHFQFTPADGTFFARRNIANGVSIGFQTPGFDRVWEADFVAPGDEPLTEGVYAGAVRYPFQGAGQPGLDVSGDGHGCNTLTGSFVVKEITYGSGADILVFWATFEQHCGGVVPALRGEVRFNADLAVFVVAPHERAVEVGQPLTFTVSATQLTAGAAALTAVGLPAGALFTDNGDSSGTFRWTPGPAQTGAHTLTFRADDGHGGTGSVTTAVKVFGSTVFIANGQPGDPIAPGRHLALLPGDGTFLAFRLFGSGVAVQFRGSGQFWSLFFGGPGDQPLVAGIYQGAQRSPFQGRPWLDVGGDGRGCNTVTGNFEIKQVVYGPNDTVTSFWATFEQHCEGGAPALIGEVRVNADFLRSPAAVWIGLANNDDVGLRVDLLAEVFVKSGATETRVGQGHLDNQPAGGSGLNNAIPSKFSISPSEGQVMAPTGAQLEFRLSVRRTCAGGGHSSGTVRLWYNGGPVDSGSKRDAGSRFEAAVGDLDAAYFLRQGSTLASTAGSSRLSIDRFVNSITACPDRPFTAFGTWTIALP